MRLPLREVLVGLLGQSVAWLHALGVLALAHAEVRGSAAEQSRQLFEEPEKLPNGEVRFLEPQSVRYTRQRVSNAPQSAFASHQSSNAQWTFSRNSPSASNAQTQSSKRTRARRARCSAWRRPCCTSSPAGPRSWPRTASSPPASTPWRRPPSGRTSAVPRAARARIPSIQRCCRLEIRLNFQRTQYALRSVAKCCVRYLRFALLHNT